MKSENDAGQFTALALQPSDETVIDSVETLTPDKVEQLKRIPPKRLGIRCRRSDCKKDLHCFDAARVGRRFAPGGCRDCGRSLIDWQDMWIRDLRDVDAKFACFEKEWIRHFFFHVPITPRIEKYARKHGLEGLAKIIEKQLRQEKMIKFAGPRFDRTQTPMLRGTIVHWARHAVACCCRACLSYWHNIPAEQTLSDDDIAYFKGLALKFIRRRIPDLT